MSDRYVIDGDIVKDTKTGLEWQAKHSGPMTWQAAMDYAKGLGDGWRLPSIEELETLLDRSRSDPASAFPGTLPEWFWSSLSYAGSAPYAWLVSFSYGGVYGDDKSSNNYVRCVRGGGGLMKMDEPERLALHERINGADCGDCEWYESPSVRCDHPVCTRSGPTVSQDGRTCWAYSHPEWKCCAHFHPSKRYSKMPAVEKEDV